MRGEGLPIAIPIGIFPDVIDSGVCTLIGIDTSRVTGASGLCLGVVVELRTGTRYCDMKVEPLLMCVSSLDIRLSMICLYRALLKNMSSLDIRLSKLTLDDPFVGSPPDVLGRG